MREMLVRDKEYCRRPDQDSLLHNLVARGARGKSD